MTGSLTLEHAIGDLSGITSIVGLPPEGPFVVYGLVGSDPSLRIRFSLDPDDPSSATGFTILAADDTIHATGDFEVSLSDLVIALTSNDIPAALAVLFQNLTSLALGPDVNLDLTTLKPGMTLTGNATGTSFLDTFGGSTIEAGDGDDTIEATVAAARIDAGDGDDLVKIHSLAIGSSIEGGEGHDTLQLVSDDDTIGIYVKLYADEIDYETPLVPGDHVYAQVTGFEFFRGSEAVDAFWGIGNGHRFEGGESGDRFNSSGDGGVLDIVDYSDEGGDRGILVNLGDALDANALPASLPVEFRNAMLEFLEPTTLLFSGFTYDTFGNLDQIEARFLIIGSVGDDVFNGSIGGDVFEGHDGDDVFFGGEGDDEIVGGAGIDRLYLSGNAAAYTITWTGSVFEIVGQDGADTVSGIEFLEFDDDTIETANLIAAPLDAVDDVAADELEEAGSGAGDSEADGNVLTNDSGTGLSVSEVRRSASGAWTSVATDTEVQGLYGTLTISADGAWSYALDQALAQPLKANEVVHEIFDYRATEGGAPDEATLDISIRGSNDLPTTAVDAFSTNEDVTLITPVATLLGNDTDPEGELLTLVSVQGGVNGVATISGSNFSFAPTAGFHGAASYTYTVEDASGGRATHSVSVSVNSVNDAPSGAGNVLTVLEEGTHQFSAADFGFTDPDDDQLAAVTIVALPLKGTIKLSGANVAAGQEVAAAQLTNLTWSPALGEHGSAYASFSFKVRDDGGTANGGLDVDPTARSISFNVTAVNDAPDGAGSTVTVSEDSQHFFAASEFGFSDVDGHSLKDVIIVSLPSSGLLTLGAHAVTAGQVIVAAQIPDLKWTPPANQSGTGLASFTFRVRDTGGTANGGVDTDASPGTITLDVTPVNDAPNGAGSAVMLLEDSAHAFTASEFGFSDSDGDTLKDVVIVSLPGRGLLTLGADVVAAGQVVAAAQIPDLKWTPPANQSGTGLALFTFSVRDAGGTANGGVDTDSSPGAITLDVTPVNDAPNGAGSAVMLLEDSAHVFAASEFGFSDPDGDTFKDVIIVSLPSSGLLTLGTGAVTAGQVISVANITDLTWTPPANQSGAGLASFTFRVRDTSGTANGGVDTDPSPGTITLDVTAVNDAPDGVGAVVTLAQNATHTFDASQFGFSDADGNALLEIVILSLPGAGVLRLGAVPVALNQVVLASELGSLTWMAPTGASGGGLASFAFVVRDNGGVANGGVDTDPSPGLITFNVTPVNSAPNGTGSTVVVLEDGSHSFNVSEFGFSDADGNALKEIVIVSLPASGALTLGTEAVVADQVIDAAQVPNLKWTPAANQNGLGIASFTFRVRDTGGTENGGFDTDATPGTITFDLVPVNDAPNGAGSTVVVVEDGVHTFSLSDFGFSDTDGDGFGSVTLASLPATGTLLLGSDVVGLNQVIAAGAIGSLKWMPPADQSGAGLASFAFIVRDTGGSANGGQDTDPTASSIVFDVAAVNDAPNGAGSSVRVTENTTHTFDMSQFGFSDPDGHDLKEIVIRSLPAVGVLGLGSVAVFVGQAIAKADIASLSWSAPPGASGLGSVTFGFEVRDTGGTANGGSDLDRSAGAITMNVAPINSAPIAAGSTLNLLEDQAYAFALPHLGFVDPNGDSLKELVVTSLPGKGVLRFGGAPVAVNQAIAAEQLGDLVWTPPAEASGLDLASIGFVVRDTGGTAGGGIDLAPVAGLVRFNVANVNDAPTIMTSAGTGTSGTISVNEGTLLATSVVATDPDSKTVKLSLVGEDKSAFVLVRGQLQFKPAPDFETPRDANRDGIYKVAIRAIDNSPGAVATTQELAITLVNKTGNIVLGDDGANTLDKTKTVAGGLVTTIEEDRIDGKGGNDVINALEGNDTLIGGLGNDKLTGGVGADRFVFDAALSSSNVDTVADYARGTDKIVLAADIFGAIGSTIEAGELRGGRGIVTAADSDDFLVYDSAKGRLYYDADGAELAFAPILFATFTKKPAVLDASDFIIV